MSSQCNVIRDLLPLYYDGVCSEESRTAVEKHLSECESCKQYYKTMGEADGVIISDADRDMELRKSASFESVRKKLFIKQFLISAVSVIASAVIVFTVIFALKKDVNVVEYNDNISVLMSGGSLIGRLNGSCQNYMQIVRVSQTSDGGEKNYLFYCLSDTKWDELVTNRNMYSEYVLCPADKGAGLIDFVYYYTGDYTGIESMSADELKKVIDSSVLLWSK